MNAHTREPFHIRILKGLLWIIWSIDWPLMVIVLKHLFDFSELLQIEL